MIHKIIAIPMAVSALALLTLGVASYWHGIPDDALWIGSRLPKPRVQVAIVKGTVHIVHSAPGAWGKVPESQAVLAGFSVKSRTIWTPGGGIVARGIGFPFWALALPLSVYPGVALVRGPVRRRRRRLRGLCLTCGYDLTGNTSGVCPECGRSTEVKNEPVWDFLLRTVSFVKVRRVAFAVWVLAAVGSAGIWIASHFTSVQSNVLSTDVVLLIADGRLYLRYEPADYTWMTGDATREDAVCDLYFLIFSRAYERRTGGTVRAATPFVTDLELDLSALSVLLAAPLGIPVLRARRSARPRSA
jgi:hypothetical protein